MPEKNAEKAYKIAKKNWKIIDEAVTHSINEKLVANGKRRLRRSALSNIHIKDFFGSGVYGYVWPTSVPYNRWAVKVTTDPLEADNTLAVILDDELRTHPGIVYFGDIWRIHGQAAYVILKEEMPDAGEGLPERSIDLLFTLHDISDMHNRDLDIPHSKSFKKAARDLESMERAMQNNPLFKHLIEFRWLFREKYGIALLDLHNENVGFRRHNMQGQTIPKLPYKHNEGKSAKYLSIMELGISDLLDFEHEIPRLANPDWIETI